MISTEFILAKHHHGNKQPNSPAASGAQKHMRTPSTQALTPLTL